VESLEDALREVLMEQLPSEYADLPQSQLDELFAEYFAELTKGMPLSFDIGETLVEILPVSQITDALAEAEDGLANTRQAIAEGIAEAEDRLEEAREYVGYFQLGYKILIGLMVLLIAGIVLLNREVKGATRKIGTTFLSYGAIWYAGILVGKHFAGTMLPEQMAKIDIPLSLQEWPLQLISDATAPLQTLSLGLLIGGVVLIVVSFVYPRWRQASEQVSE